MAPLMHTNHQSQKHRSLGLTLVRAVALTAALTLGALAALPAAEAEAQGKSKKQKSYDFEDDVIETQFLRPDVATTEGVKKDKRRSLIRIRKDFFAELIRSAEDL